MTFDANLIKDQSMKSNWIGCHLLWNKSNRWKYPTLVQVEAMNSLPVFDVDSSINLTSQTINFICISCVSFFWFIGESIAWLNTEQTIINLTTKQKRYDTWAGFNSSLKEWSESIHLSIDSRLCEAETWRNWDEEDKTPLHFLTDWPWRKHVNGICSHNP